MNSAEALARSSDAQPGDEAAEDAPTELCLSPISSVVAHSRSKSDGAEPKYHAATDTRVSGKPSRPASFLAKGEKLTDFPSVEPLVFNECTVEWAEKVCSRYSNAIYKGLHREVKIANRKKIISLILESKFNIDDADVASSITSLHLAVVLDSPDIVKLLLVGDSAMDDDLPQADIDVKDAHGRTPLTLVPSPLTIVDLGKNIYNIQNPD